MRGIPNLINMDGLEWKRDKWSFPARSWLWLNERAGCYLGNRLIADHPEFENHLATRVPRSKITMIPYGAELVVSAYWPAISPYWLEPDGFQVGPSSPSPEKPLLDTVSEFFHHRR